jgi:hypothetical protein
VHDDAETKDGGEVAPLLMLEATLSPSAEKSLKEWFHSESRSGADEACFERGGRGRGLGVGLGDVE